MFFFHRGKNAGADRKERSEKSEKTEVLQERKYEELTGNFGAAKQSDSRSEDISEDASEEKAAEEPEEAAAAENETAGSAAEVFEYFRQIAAIPHGSFNTRQLSDWLVNFARERGLQYQQDDANNVIITAPATEGYEELPPIALQGHIDMVCESDPDRQIDMSKEGVTVLEDGDWLKADGTTLGGDDGIAVAIMLAVLSDPTISHPLLECIFTSEEEVGLLGAGAIDLSGLRSRRMLNMDSEKEGVFTAGCAGGAEEVCALPLRRKEKEGTFLTVTVSGLRGGHSGDAIGLGRGNADILLARFLYSLYKKEKFSIATLRGGSRDNAIPRMASAQILVADRKSSGVKGSAEKAVSSVKTALEKRMEKIAEQITAEYALTDPDIRFTWEWKDDSEHKYVFGKKETLRLLQFVLALPNGVLEYTPGFDGLPQTSLNLGILKTTAEGVFATFLVRSSINSQKKMLMDKLMCVCEGFGGTVTTKSEYPAWEYRKDSPFRDEVCKIYEKVTGIKPEVAVIHGGLECGILASKLPGLDCVSCGPDMQGVHTYEEKLSIPSVIRTWNFVKALLAAN